MDSASDELFREYNTARTLKEIREVEQLFDPGGASHGQRVQLRAFAIFLASQSHLLRFNPSDLIPIAHNYASSGLVVDKATVLADKLKRVWVARLDRPPASTLMPARLLTIPAAGTKVQVSSDGTFAITTDGVDIFVWNLKTGALAQNFHSERDSVSDISLSADDAVAVFTQTNAGRASIVGCGVNSGATLWTVNPDVGDMQSVVTSPHGAFVAALDSDRVLMVWDTATGNCIGRFSGVTNAFTITADAKLVFITDEGTVRIFNIVDPTFLSSFSTLPDSATHLCVSADASVIATTHNNRIAVWEAASGSLVSEIKVCEKRSRIEQIVLTADARIAVTVAGADSGIAANRAWKTLNKLQVWDTFSGACVRTITSGVEDVAVSADGRIIASTDGRGDVHIWNPISNDEPDWERKDSVILSDVVVSPDFQSLMVPAFNSLRIEEVHDGASKTLQGHSGDLTSAAWSPDGRIGITGALDYAARVWDTKQGVLLRLLPAGDYVYGVGFNADSRLAICASRTLDLWDLGTGENKRTISTAAAPIRAVAVSPDDKFVVAVDSNDDICVWCLNVSSLNQPQDEWSYLEGMDDEPLMILKGHTAWILCVSLTPDGRHAVSSSADGAVVVWNFVTGRMVHSLLGHTGLVRRVVITPDGEMCLTGSADGTVRIWDLKSGSCEYVYRTERPVIGVSAIRGDGTFMCATTGEALRHLRLRGRMLGEPIVTAARLFRFAPYLARNSEFDEPVLAPGEILLGNYDSVLTARCSWCGELFRVADETIKNIQSIANTMGLKPDCSPCLNYPREVWTESGLRDQCPNCTQPLRFNPFIVDARADSQ